MFAMLKCFMIDIFYMSATYKIWKIDQVQKCTNLSFKPSVNSHLLCSLLFFLWCMAGSFEDLLPPKYHPGWQKYLTDPHYPVCIVPGLCHLYWCVQPLKYCLLPAGIIIVVTINYLKMIKL